MIISSGSDGARVKIIDFGLAQLSAASRLTAVSTPIGTDSYVSPEQMNGEVVDHRSDLWSLGVILYEMVTGKQPFRGDRREAVFYAIAHLAPEPMSRLRAGSRQNWSESSRSVWKRIRLAGIQTRLR